MSSTTASADGSPQDFDRAVTAALVKLRLWGSFGLDNDHHDQVEVGDAWDLGQGLGLVLLTKPSLTHNTPARLAATATTSATGLHEFLFRSTSSPTPPPTTPVTLPTAPPLPQVTPRTPPAALTPPAPTTDSIGSDAISHARQRIAAPTAVALCDFLARRLHAAIASSHTARTHGIHSDYNHDTVGQFVLETNRAVFSPAAGIVSVVFELLPASGSERQRLWRDRQQEEGHEEHGRAGIGATMLESVLGVVRQTLLSCAHPMGGLNAAAARAHVESVEDQSHLRSLVAASDGIAFIADGSVLPRRGGSDDRPMEPARGAVPFKSPQSLRSEFRLPHRGVVKGMLVPRGVTVIVGGGFHGKSTLLRALAVGVYNKIPGDGRELAVTDPGAVTIRAEDGRPVSGVDISPFISSLPSSGAAGGTGKAADAAETELSSLGQGAETAARSSNGRTSSIDIGMRKGGGGYMTECFSTRGASGSTSQAANVVEALEAGATALLLDEDTCAGNFMIRDSRMRAMVNHEPITPFIYRVSSLWLELGVSSVIVVGGCGDYFDVHDTAILVDNYLVCDATERAHSISRRFCVGRVQYAGRGLVHRLPWPESSSPPRAVIPESVLEPSSRNAISVSSAKRKRDHDSQDGIVCGGVTGVAGGNGCNGGSGGGHGRTRSSTDGNSPTRHDSCGQAPPAAAASAELSKEGGYGKVRSEHKKKDESQQHEEKGGAEAGEGGPPQMTGCDCPCFCGGSRLCGVFSSSGGSAVVGSDVRSSRSCRGTVARVGSSSTDLSRVEQLVGGAAMVRGCALGVGFVVRAAERSRSLSVSGALDLLDTVTNAASVHGRTGERGAEGAGGGGGGGLESLFLRASSEGMLVRREEQVEQQPQQQQRQQTAAVVPSFCGGPLVALPRRFEVAAALHRLPGVKFRPTVASEAVAAGGGPALSEEGSGTEVAK